MRVTDDQPIAAHWKFKKVRGNAYRTFSGHNAWSPSLADALEVGQAAFGALLTDRLPEDV